MYECQDWITQDGSQMREKRTYAGAGHELPDESKMRGRTRSVSDDSEVGAFPKHEVAYLKSDFISLHLKFARVRAMGHDWKMRQGRSVALLDRVRGRRRRRTVVQVVDTERKAVRDPDR